MTTQEFFDKYNNKGIDFDGAYGFQCMDLAHQYASEVVGHDFAPAPAAKDVWDQNIDGYDKIANTPDGVPSMGDIIIWGTGVGAYGHIAVFDHGDSNSFTSFDQNWPLNSLCHYQNHNYNGVLGWFHPQAAQPTSQPQPEINDQTVIDLGQYGKHEVQAIKGFYGDALNWQKDLDSANQQIHDYGNKITVLSLQVDQLNKQLADVTTTPEKPANTVPTLGEPSFIFAGYKVYISRL